VVRGQWHLAGADEEKVVGLQAVDLRCVRAQESGALHRVGLHQYRWDDRGQAVLDRLPHRKLEQTELQQGTYPSQVVEPAARHLGAAFGVDRPEGFAERQVVARLGELRPPANLTEDDEVILPAGRSTLLDQVGHRELRRLQRGLGRASGCVGRLDLIRQVLGTPNQCVPLGAGGLGHLLAELLLLGPQRLEPGHRRPARLIGGDQRVDRILRLTPHSQAGAQQFRIFSKEPQVNHDP
jgi:hypothetical protein